MAGNEPHNLIKLFEERKRAERIAKIQAEEMRKVMREEAERQQKEEDKRRAEERDRAERERYAEESKRQYARSSAGNGNSALNSLGAHIEALKAECRAMESTPQGIRLRAETVRNTRVGSRKYLEARYGIDAYEHKKSWIKLKGGCNIHKLEEMIAEQYSPDDSYWKRCECKELEELLSSEEKQRAEYEPKCRALIEYIDKIKEKQQADKTMSDRADKIRSSEVGSTEYLTARYGEKAYKTMLDMVIKEMNMNEENAAAYLTESYSEELWSSWEDKEIEELLHNNWLGKAWDYAMASENVR